MTILLIFEHATHCTLFAMHLLWAMNKLTLTLTLTLTLWGGRTVAVKKKKVKKTNEQTDRQKREIPFDVKERKRNSHKRLSHYRQAKAGRRIVLAR